MVIKNSTIGGISSGAATTAQALTGAFSITARATGLSTTLHSLAMSRMVWLSTVTALNS
jgi:hypothetical protein